MNIVFMGTPDFAAKSLEYIVGAHNILCVVTQPDRPKGRGHKMQFTPVKEVAVKNNIKVVQPKKIKEDKDAIDYIKSLNPDIIVVVAYGQVLSEEILNIPRLGCINVHASLLPKLRGAAPINRAIINGDKKTGITIMQMDKGLDTGDMLLKSEINIEDDETYGTLHDKLMNIGGELLLEALSKIDNGLLKGEKQDDKNSSYAHMMNKELGHINWDNDAKDIYNLFRGVIPWPGAFTYYDDNIIKIWDASYINDNFDKIPGEIIKADKNGVLVAAKKGAILIKELQKLGGKRLSVANFLNGNSLESGEILK